jgi:branched-chain amino acid transport system substrate-binding protein
MNLFTRNGAADRPGRRRVLGVGAVLAATSLLATTLAGCSGGSGNAATDTNKPFVIGAVNSLSGDYAAVGKNIDRGIKIAVDEINAQGGILGRQVEVKSVDDAGDPGKTQLAVKSLVEQDKIDLLLPNPISSIRQVTLPYETQRKIFSIATSTTPALGDAEKYPYSFLNGVINERRGQAMAQLIADRETGKKVGILHASQLAQQGETAEFGKLQDAFGFKVTKDIEFAGGTTDFTAQLASLRDSGAEVVVAAAQYGSFVNALMSGMQTLGWKAPVYIFPEGVTGNLAEQVPAGVSDQFNAMFETAAIKSTTTDPNMDKFVQTAAASGKIDYLMAMAYAYDDVWLAKWVYEKAQKDSNKTDGDSLKLAAETISGEKEFRYPQLVFKPNPGWTKDVHTTAAYDYSNFYGVIKSGQIDNGRYKGELFETDYSKK